MNDPDPDPDDVHGQVMQRRPAGPSAPHTGVAPDPQVTVPILPARRRRWLPAAAALATAVAVLAAAPMWGLAQRQHRPSAVPAHAGHAQAVDTTSTVAVSSVTPAHRALDRVADQLTNAAYDMQTGRYTYVHFRDWAFATSVLAVFDEQVWVAGDGSGREQRTRFPDQPVGATPRWPTARPVHIDTEDFPVGGFARSLPDPPSSNPTVLATQLDSIDPRANSPQSVLRAIADLYRDTAPSTPARAAILRVLAATPGLALRGQITDRAGRLGFAVSVDSDVRDLLILDPHTGVLLGYEAIELIKPSGSILPVGAVRESVLYLDAGRVDRYSAPPIPASARPATVVAAPPPHPGNGGAARRPFGLVFGGGW